MSGEQLRRVIAEAREAPVSERLARVMKVLERAGQVVSRAGLAPSAPRGCEALPELPVLLGLVDVVRGRDAVVRVHEERDGCVVAELASGAELTLARDEAPGAWQLLLFVDARDDLLWVGPEHGSLLDEAIVELVGMLGVLPVWRGLEAALGVPGWRPQVDDAVRAALEAASAGPHAAALEALGDALRRSCAPVLAAEPLSEREEAASELLELVLDLVSGRAVIASVDDAGYDEAELRLDDDRVLLCVLGYDGRPNAILGTLAHELALPPEPRAEPLSRVVYRLCDHVLWWTGVWPAIFERDLAGALEPVAQAPATWTPPPPPVTPQVHPPGVTVLAPPAPPLAPAPFLLRQPAASSGGGMGCHGVAYAVLVVCGLAVLVATSAGGSASSSYPVYVTELPPPQTIQLAVPYDTEALDRMARDLANLGGRIDEHGHIRWEDWRVRPARRALVAGAIGGATARRATTGSMKRAEAR